MNIKKSQKKFPMQSKFLDVSKKNLWSIQGSDCRAMNEGEKSVQIIFDDVKIVFHPSN